MKVEERAESRKWKKGKEKNEERGESKRQRCHRNIKVEVKLESLSLVLRKRKEGKVQLMSWGGVED